MSSGSTTIIDEFTVPCLDEDSTPVHTWVTHCVPDNRMEDYIRFEQEKVGEEGTEVILITKGQFLQLAAQLKGH